MTSEVQPSIDCYSCNGDIEIGMCPYSACTTKCFSAVTVSNDQASTARGCLESESDFDGKDVSDEYDLRNEIPTS